MATPAEGSLSNNVTQPDETGAGFSLREILPLLKPPNTVKM